MTKKPQPTMYLGVGTALPKESNKNFKQGANHALLVFVQADSEANADRKALEHLVATGWEDVSIDRLNAVDLAALEQAQPDVVQAYELAMRDGSHAMILERPSA